MNVEYFPTICLTAVPDSPYDVTLDQCNNDNAVVHFTFLESMRNFVPMKNFSIEAMTNHESNKWIEVNMLPWRYMVSGIVGLAPKWVRLAPNGTNPGLFQIRF